MPDIGKLLTGFRLFKATNFLETQDIIKHSISKIQPSTLIITSCSIQISPDRMLDCNPGELFVIRNLGGLVPKYSTMTDSTIAGIEYGVKFLKVENIIVLGHNFCHSCIDLIRDNDSEINSMMENKMIAPWLLSPKETRDAVIKELHDKNLEGQEKIYGQELIIKSIKNLLDYPVVKSRLSDNLTIFGWHFDIISGDLMTLDPDSGYFEPIS